jgi:hypothetical protein
MALFSNFGVNHAKDVTGLRNRLCGVHEYASAQFLDFLELAENGVFLDRKLISALNETVDGHYLDHKKTNCLRQRRHIHLSPFFYSLQVLS